jgi:cell division protein FtsB
LSIIMIRGKLTVNINMRISKYIIGVWTAVAVYSIFSFFCGPKGLSAYNQLLFERDQQWSNIKELGIINEELEKERNNLLYDQDTLLVHARRLGYGYEDERFIRIVGLGNIKNTPAVTGNVYTIKDPDYISDKTIKIVSISIGLLLFAFLFMLEIIDSKVK